MSTELTYLLAYLLDIIVGLRISKFIEKHHINSNCEFVVLPDKVIQRWPGTYVYQGGHKTYRDLVYSEYKIK